MTLQIFTTRQRFLGPARGSESDLESIPLDAVLEEGTETRLNVTTFPVELGSEISDHAIVVPRTYTMRGVVTDTPGLKYRFTSKYRHVATTTRSTAAYALIEDLQAKRQPFDILTGFRLYENMIITSLATTRNERTQAMIAFRASLLQIIIVGNKHVPAFADDVADSASPEVDNGHQQGEEVVMPSLLKQAVSFFSGP